MRNISGTTTTSLSPVVEPREVIELHWMPEPDLAMHVDHGISTPALCGAWMEPDESLAEAISSGATRVRYASCAVCDLLHALTAG